MIMKSAGLALYILSWVVMPGAVLLPGTLPFLRNSARKAV